MKMFISYSYHLMIVILFLPLFFSACSKKAVEDDEPTPLQTRVWKIENGKFYENGEWKFLKIAKPLRNYASSFQVEQLIADLDMLKNKKFDVISINCYWHYFDNNADGIPDQSLEPLKKLVDAIYAKGMYPALSVETYSVGGGAIPNGFWTKYPDAYAINHKGELVTDTEYGFGTKVVSIFHAGYRETIHSFIKSLAKAVDTKKLIYFETTVEPQYMGAIELCYSESARVEYNKWLKEKGITDPASIMPETFPMPNSFITNEHWNNFRAEFLAKWVNEDAAAFREVAGEGAYVAVDFLDADEGTTRRRNGNPKVFLSNITEADIIQVNWSWYFPENKPNQKAYDRVYEVIDEKKRNWVVTEHMTLNGADFARYSDEELKVILTNTLEKGTRFGWEFTNVVNSSGDTFALYNNDWSPKRVMRAVDYNWDEWLETIKTIEENN